MVAGVVCDLTELLVAVREPVRVTAIGGDDNAGKESG
jgi:hypothetical protein